MEKIRTLGEITYLVRMRWVVLISLIISFSYEMISIGISNTMTYANPVKSLLETVQPVVAGIYFLIVLVLAIVALVLGRKFWKTADKKNEAVKVANFKTNIYIVSVAVFAVVIPLAGLSTVIVSGNDAWGYFCTPFLLISHNIMRFITNFYKNVDRNVVWTIYYLVFFAVTLAFLQRNLVPYNRPVLHKYWSKKTLTNANSTKNRSTLSSKSTAVESMKEVKQTQEKASSKSPSNSTGSSEA
jgi:hypothetical protein